MAQVLEHPMAREAKSGKKTHMVTVKIEDTLHRQAKAIAAVSEKSLEEILSDLLRKPLQELFRKEMERVNKESAS